MATLRAVYMDLANELGDQGFRWIFLVHNHGAPNHHNALNQASDYFHDTYGGTMVHLFGLKPVFLCCGTKDSSCRKTARDEEGFTVHAGADETSSCSIVRPDLIAPDFAKAPSFTAQDFEDHVKIAKADGWPGYFGAPRLATPPWARRSSRSRRPKLVKVALADPRRSRSTASVPRYADEMDPLDVAGEHEELAFEKAIDKRQQDWLTAHHLQ